MDRRTALPGLSKLEGRIMDILWSSGTATAEEVRKALADEHELTDSSVRTLLRRLEAKGYATHERDGRRFLFRARVARRRVAASAARRIIDTICGGEPDLLLLGMVDGDLISEKEIESIRSRLDEMTAGETAREEDRE